MGNKKLIIAIIIVILLIGGLVGGFWYIQNNSKQAEILHEEMKKVAESDFLDTEIDMEIQSTGEYGKVEQAVKEYVSNVKKIYTELKDFGGNSQVSNILSAENISADADGLTVVQQKVDEYKQKLTELTSQVSTIASEDAILKAIEEKDIKDNYINVYKDIMLSEAVEANLKNVEQKAETEKLKAEEKLDGIEKVVSFLKTNAKYWNVEGGKLQFNNVNKLGEYYQLLNGME